MRYFPWLIIGVILGLVTVAGGQTTRPVATVIIFPFRQLGDANAHGWISTALRDQFTSITFGANGLRAVPADSTLGAADPATALAAGRAAQVDLVVFGSYQVTGDDLAVNGQVDDLVRQEPLGVLRASGKIVDFFKIEDGLARQFLQALAMLNPQAGPQGRFIRRPAPRCRLTRMTAEPMPVRQRIITAVTPMSIRRCRTMATGLIPSMTLDFIRGGTLIRMVAMAAMGGSTTFMGGSVNFTMAVFAPPRALAVLSMAEVCAQPRVWVAHSVVAGSAVPWAVVVASAVEAVDVVNAGQVNGST